VAGVSLGKSDLGEGRGVVWEKEAGVNHTVVAARARRMTDRTPLKVFIAGMGIEQG
jgi:hypothetical protein